MLYDVNVQLGDRSYPIYIGSGILDQLGSLLVKLELNSKCLVIADENSRIFFDEIFLSLQKVNINCSLVEVKSGEASKSLEQVSILHSECINASLDRNSFIIALGGGVIGDLAGYVAASFLRGISFVQVPTTLLAMVDSSVGGKTGVNLKEGKNLVGAFHQPSLVLSDLKTLKTLPKREISAGMAEVIKYGIIYDAVFFNLIESVYSDLDILKDIQQLANVVGRCCEIKAEIVALDERESGLRAILNFGHTLGHAIENCTGYGQSFIHGEAISIGMIFASQLSIKCCNFSKNGAQRIKNILKNVGLPEKSNELVWEDLKDIMMVDKKTINGIPQFVLVTEIGKVSIGHEVDENILKEAWNSLNE